MIKKLIWTKYFFPQSGQGLETPAWALVAAGVSARAATRAGVTARATSEAGVAAHATPSASLVPSKAVTLEPLSRVAAGPSGS